MQRRFPQWFPLLTLMLLAGVAMCGRAWAQEPDLDPPGRVARLSELNGQVWLYTPESGEWVGADRNRPLTTGDRLATEGGARAELQIGSMTVRLDASTELEVVQLDDEHVTLDLRDGSAIAQIRDLAGAGQFELVTDEGRFVALRAGVYRFDRLNGRSDLSVYAGQARYEGPNSGLPVNAGQRADFWIDSGGVAQYSAGTPVNDAFTAWSAERDRRFAGAVAERYVSPEMTGAAELDAYGRWEQTPDYGSVWIPTAVAADWAPYSQGHWAFVRPWGWTWIDDAPWGFAPFHYGRWVYLRNNWCWTPGVRVARPVYAPALVAWVGGARGGGPSVGWFPLAPREVYVPSYRVSPRYARNLNITNVTNVTVINNVFANPQAPRDFENRRSPRGLTVVPSNVLTERRPVGPAAAQYRQTPWVRDFANGRDRASIALAPSVATPTPTARSGDPRAVRPPPGARPDAGERAGERGGERGGAPFVRPPGFADRDRANENSRERERRAPAVPPQAAQQPAPAAAPLPGVSVPPAPGRPREAFDPGQRGRVPAGDGPGRMPREFDRRAEDPVPRVPMQPAPAPQAPAVQPARPPAPAPTPQAAQPPARPQEMPTMRALPVQRSEDRRIEERRLPRPEGQPAPVFEQRQVQPPRVDRPAPPISPPAPQPVAPRPPEVQRAPAPVAAPAPRVEPPRGEAPRPQRPPEPRGDDQPQRRGDARDAR